MTTETTKLTGDEYMALLVRRKDEWLEKHPLHPGAKVWAEPLLTWFIEPGDENLVDLPEIKPAPERAPKPRVYRSAASLREERDGLVEQRDAITADEGGDLAETNLSPHSRSRAARNAGRRRFAKLDRDLERVAKLTRRIDSLNSRIARAEAREERAQTTTTKEN